MKAILTCLMCVLLATPAFARGGSHGGGHGGHGGSHVNRGGHYAGGHGSSHKGGHYKNKRTHDHYTRRNQ